MGMKKKIKRLKIPQKSSLIIPNGGIKFNRQENESYTKRLASNDFDVRMEALTKLSKHLEKKGDQYDDTKMLILWKGLFFCLWMSDKTFAHPFEQSECADKITALIHKFPTPQSSLLYLKCYFDTVLREWLNIDRQRVDKYLMLNRKMLHQTFVFASKNPGCLEELGNLLLEVPLNAFHYDEIASITKHIVDIYLHELYKAVGSSANPDLLYGLLKPIFVSFQHFSADIQNTISHEITIPLVTQYIPPHLQEESDSDDNEENRGEDEVDFSEENDLEKNREENSENGIDNNQEEENFDQGENGDNSEDEEGVYQDDSEGDLEEDGENANANVNQEKKDEDSQGQNEEKPYFNYIPFKRLSELVDGLLQSKHITKATRNKLEVIRNVTLDASEKYTMEYITPSQGSEGGQILESPTEKAESEKLTSSASSETSDAGNEESKGTKRKQNHEEKVSEPPKTTQNGTDSKSKSHKKEEKGKEEKVSEQTNRVDNEGKQDKEEKENQKSKEEKISQQPKAATQNGNDNKGKKHKREEEKKEKSQGEKVSEPPKVTQNGTNHKGKKHTEEEAKVEPIDEHNKNKGEKVSEPPKVTHNGVDNKRKNNKKEKKKEEKKEKEKQEKVSEPAKIAQNGVDNKGKKHAEEKAKVEPIDEHKEEKVSEQPKTTQNGTNNKGKNNKEEKANIENQSTSNSNNNNNNNNVTPQKVGEVLPKKPIPFNIHLAEATTPEIHKTKPQTIPSSPISLRADQVSFIDPRDPNTQNNTNDMFSFFNKMRTLPKKSVHFSTKNQAQQYTNYLNSLNHKINVPQQLLKSPKAPIIKVRKPVYVSSSFGTTSNTLPKKRVRSTDFFGI